ncbi:class D beta-lactamase [Vallitalea okinawensis]|uniref:class D beta-lactamase n=1 Tax=Vallitalea okinawensis TaxID=2078660 RepID=UPI000CFE0B23|nr:class D beta-lactamase [Vallitalea okinawensis]
MKKIILLFITLLITMISLSACDNVDQEADSITISDFSEPYRISDDLTIEKVQEQVYVVNHEFPWPANSLIVEMDNGELVLVDTPYTPEATQLLLEWMEEEFGERSTIAINTHFHFDNLGGNQALINNDIPIYGSSMIKEMIEERGEAARQLMLSWLSDPKDEDYKKKYEELEYIVPTEVFNIQDGMTLTFDKEVVEIFYPGESHSLDAVVVYFPDKKVLFGGCMMKSLDDYTLGNTADANIKEWPKSVKKVNEEFSDVGVVIPGHGQWGNRELITHTINLFDIEENTTKVIEQDLSQYFQGYEGCFILYDSSGHEYVVYNEEKSQKQIPPCSTFKIYHSLIGLETGVLEDQNTVFQWDGTEQPIESWNQDHTLKTAVANSVVWYFQQVATEIGEDRMASYLEEFNYGNKDISGGQTEFWLQSSLKISPMEQVNLLSQFYNYELPVKKENINIVKDILILSEENGRTLSGKTGTGVVDGNVVNGWFVGYMEEESNVYYFACNIEAEKDAYSSEAKKITEKILKDKGLY